MFHSETSHKARAIRKRRTPLPLCILTFTHRGMAVPTCLYSRTHTGPGFCMVNRDAALIQLFKSLLSFPVFSVFLLRNPLRAKQHVWNRGVSCSESSSGWYTKTCRLLVCWCCWFSSCQPMQKRVCQEWRRSPCSTQLPQTHENTHNSAPR